MSPMGLFVFLARRMALFFLAMVIQAGVGVALVKRGPRGRAWRWLLVGLFALGNLPFLFILVDWLAWWKLPSAWYRAVVYPFTVWQVACLFVGIWFLGGWAVFRIRGESAARSDLGKGAIEDPSRRRFLVAGAGLAAAGGAVFASKGLGIGAGRPRVRSVRIFLADLSPLLDGMRIVQVTDIHCGYFFDTRRLEALSRQVNSLRPDLIVLTGDQMHAFHGDFVRDLVTGLAGLRAPGGVLAVLGNHDYRAGADLVCSGMEKAGWTVLRNSNVRVPLRGSSLFVSGIDDWGHEPDLNAALRSRGDGPVLLLSHRPNVFDDAVRAEVDLVLAGHTHGGQIRIGPLDPALVVPHVRGLFHRGRTTMYVCSGVGLTGPPLRIGVPPELGLIELRRG